MSGILHLPLKKYRRLSRYFIWRVAHCLPALRCHLLRLQRQRVKLQIVVVVHPRGVALEKLNRDRRLVLLSDPVTMSRLHYRVWSSPERYSSWVNYYNDLKLNPLALKAK